MAQGTVSFSDTRFFITTPDEAPAAARQRPDEIKALAQKSMAQRQPSELPDAAKLRTMAVDSLAARKAGAPVHRAKATDDAGLATFVGQQDLGPPGEMGLGLRGKIGMAQRKTEKLLEFQKEFPEGDLVFVPDIFDPLTSENMLFGTGGELVPRAPDTPEGDTILFRPDKATPYARMDAAILGQGGAHEVVGDLIDFFAPDIGAIIGETTALSKRVGAATRFVGKVIPPLRGVSRVATEGVGLIEQLFRMAVGAFGGELAQEGVQKLRGTSTEDIADVARRGVGQAIAAVIPATLIDKLGRPVVNALRGGGFIARRRGAEGIMAAAERLDLPSLPVNVISDNPLVRRIGAQAKAATASTGFLRYFEDISIGLNKAVKDLAAAARRAASTPEDAMTILERVHRQQRQNILTKARTTRGIGVAEAPLRTGPRGEGARSAGEAQQRGLAEYDTAAKAEVNAAYNVASAVEEPRFQSDFIKDAADEVLTGVQAPVVRQTPTEGILDAQGRVVPGSDVAERVELVRVNELRAETREIAELLRDIDPDLPKSVPLEDGSVVELSPNEYLRALRSRAFEAKTPLPGEIMRSEHRDAAKLFGAIDQTLRNPINENKLFTDLWARANNLARERFSTVELIQFKRIAKSETPRQLAARVADLSSLEAADHLEFLRGILPAERYRQMQTGLVVEFLDDLPNLKTKLEAARPENLDFLLSKNDQAILRKAGDSMEILNRLGLDRIAKDQADIGKAVYSVIESGRGANIVELDRIIRRHGGKDGPLGRHVRSGIVNEFFQRVASGKSTIGELSTSAINAEVGKLKSSGAWKLLDFRERRLLSDVRLVQNAMQQATDVGASMSGASVARGGVLRGDFAPLLKNIGIANVFSSRAGMAILTGSRKVGQLGPSQTANLIGAVITQAASDAEAVYEDAADLSGAVLELLTPGQQ